MDLSRFKRQVYIEPKAEPVNIEKKEPINTKEYYKQYYKENKDKIKQRNNKYYESHKEKIKQYHENIPTIICSCGSQVKQCNLARHLKTAKHQNNI